MEKRRRSKREGREREGGRERESERERDDGEESKGDSVSVKSVVDKVLHHRQTQRQRDDWLELGS